MAELWTPDHDGLGLIASSGTAVRHDPTRRRHRRSLGRREHAVEVVGGEVGVGHARLVGLAPRVDRDQRPVAASAHLPLDWLTNQPLRIGQLLLLHGSPPRVEYHGKLEGVTLAVDLYTVHEVNDAPADRPPPGRVSLVTGDIGPSDRSWLRPRRCLMGMTD